MSADRKAPEIYTIPAGTNFGKALALGIFDRAESDAFPLTSFRILLPTRRACRNLRDTFLQLSNGKPILLPRLQPLGDVDEDELVLKLASKENISKIIDLPPSIPPLKRQILLARIIAKLPQGRSDEQNFALAGALGRLMDQIYTEDLDLKNLPSVVKEETLAEHWQITVRFLEILSEEWPKILAENHVIDAADRRNRLMQALATHWEENPPQTPVIAAGSTGSIPATGRILKTVSQLPHGAIVLPDFDRDIDEKSWDAIDDTHPQATLKDLIDNKIGVDRKNIQLWPYAPEQDRYADKPDALAEKTHTARYWLAREMMRPAATAEHWRTLNPSEDQKHTLRESLKSVMRFDCATAEEEAKLIGVIMRSVLEESARTAALITPDRNLARRVAMVCRRWGIEIDDSGGTILNDSPFGSFFRLIINAAAGNFKTSTLVNLLKHKYCRNGTDDSARTEIIDQIEIALLRGPVKKGGLKKLVEEANEEGIDTAFLEKLSDTFGPLTSLEQSAVPFVKRLDAHITVAEKLAQNESGEDNLWRGDEGEAAAIFLSSLRDHAGLMPDTDSESYTAILEQLMRTVNIRSPYGLHPRLFIFGQLEARLINADLVILGGLNEGTWPADSGSDPWMSRPMRKEFALPSPERGIGLSAHDFVQGFCTDNIVLTRAERVDGTPTIPARWLQRLDTVLQALDIDHKTDSHAAYLEMAREIDKPEGEPQPVKRPEPRPPSNKRPDSMYVTHIEKWMRDPYSIYARYILDIKKLPDLEQDADAADRGSKIHEALDDFVKEHMNTLPDDAYDRLITIGKQKLENQLEDPRLWGFWWPRFERLADWFVSHERQWRLTAKPAALEAKGSASIDIDGIPFRLSAKADRIDKTDTGYAVIDYKTGTTPSARDINNGYAPQLPLEGVIIEEGGFPELTPNDITYLGFWKLTGAVEAGEEKPVKADIEQARQGLIRLVRTFRQEDVAYYSLPRPDKAPPEAWQDYAHLARVQEWAALDDSSEAA